MSNPMNWQLKLAYDWLRIHWKLRHDGYKQHQCCLLINQMTPQHLDLVKLRDHHIDHVNGLIYFGTIQTRKDWIKKEIRLIRQLKTSLR